MKYEQWVNHINDNLLPQDMTTPHICLDTFLAMGREYLVTLNTLPRTHQKILRD